MNYKFECNLNDKDYYEFNKHHFFYAPEMRVNNLIGKLFVPIIFLIILIYYFFNGYDILYIIINIFLFTIFSIIWFFMFKYLTLAFLKGYIRMMKKNGKMPYSLESVLKFYDDNFVEITTDTKTEITYSAVLRVDVSDIKNIYIYTNPILAYIIPFSSFTSLKEQENFLEFIKEKVKIKSNNR